MADIQFTVTGSNAVAEAGEIIRIIMCTSPKATIKASESGVWLTKKVRVDAAGIRAEMVQGIKNYLTTL